jgi:hypothetical protein
MANAVFGLGTRTTADGFGKQHTRMKLLKQVVSDITRLDNSSAIDKSVGVKAVHYKLPADSAAQPKSAGPWAARRKIF